MLFQAVVLFLPILNFFKFHVKGERSIEIAKKLSVKNLKYFLKILKCFELLNFVAKVFY